MAFGPLGREAFDADWGGTFLFRMGQDGLLDIAYSSEGESCAR